MSTREQARRRQAQQVKAFERTRREGRRAVLFTRELRESVAV